MPFDFATAKKEKFDFSSVAPVNPQEPGVSQDNYPSDYEILRGMGEVALTMGTGTFAEIAGGVSGIYEGISKFISGEDDLVDSATDKINSVSGSLTYAPRTDEGKMMLKMLGIPFQSFDDYARSKGNKWQEMTGSAAVAALARTAVLSAPDLIGLKGARTRGVNRAAVRSLEREAKDINLDVTAHPDTQKAQLVTQASKETGGRVVKGQDLTGLQSLVKSAKQSAKANVDQLYKKARSEVAGVQADEAVKFSQSLRDTLDTEGFLIEDMPAVKGLLDDLAKVEELPSGSYIKLEAVDKWRRTINRKKNKISAEDYEQAAVLGLMKGQLDKFLDAQFNADMIKGSPDAINSWKNARSASASYIEKFRSDKVIKELAEQQASPEEIRSWLFGTSKLGFKKESGKVIGRIKAIVGEDSPQFNALRQDALLNILDPLLKSKPDLKQFARVYDDMVKNNPTLANELFPESVTSLSSLRKFAAAVENNKSAPIPLRISETISRALVGHQIAKAAIRVSLMGNVLKLLGKAGGKTQRARVLGDILGYDPTIPVLPAKVPLIGGAIEAGTELSDTDREIKELIRK